ncbi:uncharacterized protein L969DRAFT_20283 [Mixia osmundae IAM 14324]|uniref:AB hydrolase-1 domain-containing protein n=1 Tax=Mixia osmundae (strain CBS 9802 / IAM 14324 / JCM 22182 / KY 12970) TaxID=764103 RepID=G7E890_MIXOS|nr:uncharacterized protein L969DRAFT_20283 [Mixia osmundae IAM 14324]KEI36543.1 hypothetical protein L969DRAFT_20283 [Mixia osmundae IAM 14324]GAA99050.1 hypothetical protein E5Q_05739 [Mixia osmundae IAM 14324]
MDLLSSEDVSRLIPIGNGRQLYVHATGPYVPDVPLVFIVPGMGDCSATWLAVHRAISFARVFSYDRAGLGRSPDVDQERTMDQILEDLTSLLKAAPLPGPFVFVGHSYGGTILRALLAKQDSLFAGYVAVDAIPETWQRPWPKDDIMAVWADVDYFEVSGLNSDNVLTPAEWKRVHELTTSDEDTQNREDKYSMPSHEALYKLDQLGGAPLLGNRPVCVVKGDVVRDFQRICDAGVKAGNGTPEQQKVFQDIVELYRSTEDELHERQLKLSTRGHIIRTRHSGHNVQATEPEPIAQGIRWVLRQLATL